MLVDAATIAGAAGGGALGTLAECKLNRQDASRITAELRQVSTVRMMQPPGAGAEAGNGGRNSMEAARNARLVLD